MSDDTSTTFLTDKKRIQLSISRKCTNGKWMEISKLTQFLTHLCSKTPIERAENNRLPANIQFPTNSMLLFFHLSWTTEIWSILVNGFIFGGKKCAFKSSMNYSHKTPTMLRKFTLWIKQRRILYFTQNVDGSLQIAVKAILLSIDFKRQNTEPTQ